MREGKLSEPPAESSPAEALEVEDPVAPRPQLGFLEGISLVVGLQIGSGIFSSPNQIHVHAGSVGASLLVWVLSGLLAWTGAASYAELGSAIPRSGGPHAYLQHIYGDYVAYLFSWAMLTIVKPGGAAIIASVLGEYVSRDPVVKRAVAAAAVLATMLANWLGVGVHASTFFLGLKLVLLVAVLVCSSVLAARRDLSHMAVWSGTHSFGDIAVALYGGIWAYDGWDNLNYVAGDMRNPGRDLPRVLATAMPVVIVAYLGVNIGYFAALDSDDLDASTSVALTVATQLHSKALAVLLAAGIALSCTGALNASLFSVAKLVQVVAADRVLPAALLKRGYALLFQGLLTIVYICLGEFGSLVQFYGAMNFFFYATVVAGLLRLRWTEPSLLRPYRTWLVTPIVFLGLAATLLVRTVMSRPLIVPAALAFFLLGSPIFWLSRRSAQSSEARVPREALANDAQESPAGRTPETQLAEDAAEFEIE